MSAAADLSPSRQMQAALWYAGKRGWPVDPAHFILPDGNCSCGNVECSSPGKHPLTANGFKNATTDAETIRSWWSQHPEANLILPTGQPTGLLVLDIDPGHGGNETLAALEAKHGSLPPTMEQITGSGGRHLLFKFPGPEYRNTAGRVGPGIDSRGDGGYIIVAPSNHKSGNDYQWREGHNPTQIELADAPGWLLNLLRKDKPEARTHTRTTNGGAYVETALADEVKATATAAKGTRNAQLNRSAFNLGQFVGAELLDRGRVERALTDAALTAGLIQAEIEATIKSGIEAGMAEPRDVPVRDGGTHHRARTAASNGAGNTPAPLPAVDARPWPGPLDAGAFHGLAGQFIRTVEPHSEADPVALLVQFLIGYGNAVGRGPHFVAESDRHGLNLNGVFVGETSKGRKGTSWGHVRRSIAAVDQEWTGRLMSGLSSGEGLIWQVRDEIKRREAIKEKGRVKDYEEVTVDEGVKDKRLLVFEGEFASVLRVCGRDGNTLSAVIRNAWDNGNLRTLTKNNPAVATGAHISIIGHITRDELLRYLDDTEAANGFANRFLWLCVKRSKVLPEGGHLTDADLAPVVNEVAGALDFARSVGEMRRDAAAREVWHAVYEDLSEGKPGLLGAMIARSEAQVMRLACIYALLDCCPMIGRTHLEAALAVWEYVETSARYIFGARMGDPVADRIAEALAATPDGLTRTQISGLFGRHQRSAAIDRALTELKKYGIANRTLESSGDGRHAEIWRRAVA